MSHDERLGLRPQPSPDQPVSEQLTSEQSTSQQQDSSAARKSSLTKRVRTVILGPAGRYLLVGGLSFAVDFFLLVFLHEYFAVELWLATPIAFLTSLVVNYLLSRFFTFAGVGARGTSFLKYIALVVFNTAAASLIVSGFEAVGSSYMLGKVASTVLMTIWNFFAYKHWVFAQRKTPRTA